MARITRDFTIAELRALDLPPDDPDEPDEFPEHVLADEHLGNLKYTASRRVIFQHDGRTWAVEYEARMDVGDHEFGDYDPDDHGWWGDTVTATAVEEREVTVTKWVEADA
ncbi:hypothetical protein [Kitasatospora sp. NPDC004289]